MTGKRAQNTSFSIHGENVVGMINASGSARIHVNQKVIQQVSPQIDKAFKRAHKRIQTRPVASQGETAKLEKQVKKIEAEVAKGEQADTNKLEHWIRALAKMGPDIVEVMAASLGGPVAGFTMVFKKILERAQALEQEGI